MTVNGYGTPSRFFDPSIASYLRDLVRSMFGPNMFGNIGLEHHQAAEGAMNAFGSLSRRSLTWDHHL